MGGFVDFKCMICKYEGRGIGVGRGKNEFPILVLFRCDYCKSINGIWAGPDKSSRCIICYHDTVTFTPRTAAA